MSVWMTRPSSTEIRTNLGGVAEVSGTMRDLPSVDHWTVRSGVSQRGIFGIPSDLPLRAAKCRDDVIPSLMTVANEGDETPIGRPCGRQSTAGLLVRRNGVPASTSFT